MSKPLEWSPRSLKHVKAIRDYIAADNPTAAISVLSEIKEKAENLTQFPMLGRQGRATGTRELVISKYPYILIYKLTATKIKIAAVVHQSKKYQL
jgi:toxin ParE1/3/4